MFQDGKKRVHLNFFRSISNTNRFPFLNACKSVWKFTNQSMCYFTRVFRELIVFVWSKILGVLVSTSFLFIYVIGDFEYTNAFIRQLKALYMCVEMLHMWVWEYFNTLVTPLIMLFISTPFIKTTNWNNKKKSGN